MTPASQSPRILFIHHGLSPFIQLDLGLLRSIGEATDLRLESPLRVQPRRIAAAVRDHDLVFGWFASWHTFLPFLFARLSDTPSILVIGGYDVARLPEIGYGHQRGGLKRWLSRWTMNMASRLVTFSHFSQEEAGRNAGIQPERVGVIPLGIPDPFKKLPPLSRRQMALTVGNVERSNLWRKGHEPFVRAAAHLPQMEFVLAGEWQDRAIDRLKKIASPNVAFPGRVNDDELLRLYQEAAVYVQPSRHEGFGMSVAEAMLAGCIPVVTRLGALPEVVGDAGVYLPNTTPEAVAEGIRSATGAGEDLRSRARKRILDEFPLAKRGQALADLVHQLLTEQRP
ncbi:MAG: glycosyltransferase [Chloroflexota bacterium]